MDGKECDGVMEEHCVYNRTVSAYRLLSAFLNWFELVHRQFGQSNMNCMLNSHIFSPSGLEVPTVLIYIHLYTVIKEGKKLVNEINLSRQ